MKRTFEFYLSEVMALALIWLLIAGCVQHPKPDRSPQSRYETGFIPSEEATSGKQDVKQNEKAAKEASGVPMLFLFHSSR